MNILRRLKEASVEHLGVYRNNAWLLTLKQNIGPFLKGELSPEQLDVRGTLSLTLKDLVFDEQVLNELLITTGLIVHEIKVNQVDIDLSSVTCKIDGIHIILGVSPTPNLVSKNNTKKKSKKEKSNQTKDERNKQTQHIEDEMKSDALQALSVFVNEVIDMINSYLDVTIHNMNISMKFSHQINAVKENNNNNNDDDICLSLHIPMFSFRDNTSDTDNNETLQNISR
jgi:hypothetical protein